MNNELFCPNCNELVEDDAIFCGNCGFKLKDKTPTPVSGRTISYAIRYPHRREHWPSNSLILGLIAIPASLILPILGLILAILALFMATASNKKSNFKFRLFGSILASIAILIVVGTFIFHKNSPSSTANSSSVIISTPCYKIKVSSIFTVENTQNSCNVKFYYGTSISSSSDLYVIRSQIIPNLTIQQFNSKIQSVINNDLNSHIQGFVSINNSTNTFVSSPSYWENGYSSTQNISISERAILRTNTMNKDNYFDIVHSQTGKNLSVDNLAKSWIWEY